MKDKFNQSEGVQLVDPLTCGSCKYWCPMPTNPLNLKESRGECRKDPPQVSAFLTPQGQLAGSVALYPNLQKEFLACSHHEKVLAGAEKRTEDRVNKPLQEEVAGGK